MNFRLLALGLSLIFFAACSNDEACKLMQNGTFKYGDDIKSETVIERLGSRQTEINDKAGFKDVYTIKFTSACEYYLVLEETNKPSIDYTITKEDTMFVKMMKIEGNTINYYARLGNQSFNGVMVKIR